MNTSNDYLRTRRCWFTVALFAIAMAWVEAAVVFYLRTMMDRLVPYQPEPFPVIGNFAPTELAREVATLVMLLAVGMLAGRTWRSRFGYAAVAFGVWDIFYYVFLRIMASWPRSLLDWDILFLLPLPWWGPVLAPVLISLLMILWGTVVTQFERIAPAAVPNWKLRAIGFLGIVLALYVFMADTIQVADQGVDAIRNVLPTRFNWPLFCLALGLMAVPVVRVAGQIPLSPRDQRSITEVANSLACKRSPQN